MSEGNLSWLRSEVLRLKDKVFEADLAEEKFWHEYADAGIEVYRHEQAHGPDRWAARHKGETFASVDSQRFDTPREAIRRAVARFNAKGE